MTRRILVAALVAAGVLALAGSAQAEPKSALPEGGCAAFGRTQTYEWWGPALYYERPVTVAYSITDCSATLDGDTFSMSTSGTATITDAETGETLDSRPFSASGTWTDPTGAGWPPAWWSCSVADADFSWQIEGAYSFNMNAAGGHWTLDVSVPGADGVHFEYSAC